MSRYATNQGRAAALFRLATTLPRGDHERALMLASQIDDGETFAAADVDNLAQAEADLRALVGFVEQIAAQDPRALPWANEARRQYIDVLAEQAKEESTATQPDNTKDDRDTELADDNETDNQHAGHLANA